MHRCGRAAKVAVVIVLNGSDSLSAKRRDAHGRVASLAAVVHDPLPGEA